MTTREFLNAVITNQVTEDVVAFAKGTLVKLDERNAKRSSKPSKTAVANEPIKGKILAFLSTNDRVPAANVGTACEITTQKASALLRQLVEEGKVVSMEVKIPKKGKVKAYTLVKEETSEEKGE